MTSDMQNSSPSQTPGNAGAPVKKAQASGLPVRGLAMILIAVAVLLAAWALWSLSSDNDPDSAATGTDTIQSQDEGTQNASNDGGASGGSDVDGASGEGASGENAEAEAPREEDGARDVEAAENEDTPAAQPPARPAAEGTPVTTLHVLNNSTVTQLAARVADSLNGDYEKVESGNLADVAIPQNTVYFTKDNPDAEKEARKLADRVGGIAMERSNILPEETDGDDAIVLVLTEDVTL